MITLLLFALGICAVFGGIVLHSYNHPENGLRFISIGGVFLLSVVIIAGVNSEVEIQNNPKLLAVRDFCHAQNFNYGSLENLSSSKYVICSSGGSAFRNAMSKYYTSEEFGNWVRMND